MPRKQARNSRSAEKEFYTSWCHGSVPYAWKTVWGLCWYNEKSTVSGPKTQSIDKKVFLFHAGNSHRPASFARAFFRNKLKGRLGGAAEIYKYICISQPLYRLETDQFSFQEEVPLNVRFWLVTSESCGVVVVSWFLSGSDYLREHVNIASQNLRPKSAMQHASPKPKRILPLLPQRPAPPVLRRRKAKKSCFTPSRTRTGGPALCMVWSSQSKCAATIA